MSNSDRVGEKRKKNWEWVRFIDIKESEGRELGIKMIIITKKLNCEKVLW